MSELYIVYYDSSIIILWYFLSYCELKVKKIDLVLEILNQTTKFNWQRNGDTKWSAVPSLLAVQNIRKENAYRARESLLQEMESPKAVQSSKHRRYDIIKRAYTTEELLVSMWSKIHSLKSSENIRGLRSRSLYSIPTGLR